MVWIIVLSIKGLTDAPEEARLEKTPLSRSSELNDIALNGQESH